jgi:hypothetical protein
MLAVGVPHTAVGASSKITLHAVLKGSNEVGGAFPKNGKGTATVTVDMSKNKLCWSLSVSGFKLPAIASHIHAGHAGKNGPIVVPFNTSPGKIGKAVGCTTVKSSSLLKAIAGHPTSYYVNVHTTTYPGGAVRGQLGM